MSNTTHVNLAHAREAHQRTVMEQIVKDGVCPFCYEHLERYHTEPLLFETEHWVATTNFAPYPGSAFHFLLIARTHHEDILSLSNEERIDLFTALDRLNKEYTIPGGTVIMRFGDTEYTGGSVTHLHAQLVVGAPRSERTEPIRTFIGYQKKIE
jgi:ATP adenylyltransferase